MKIGRQSILLEMPGRERGDTTASCLAKESRTITETECPQSSRKTDNLIAELADQNAVIDYGNTFAFVPVVNQARVDHAKCASSGFKS